LMEAAVEGRSRELMAEVGFYEWGCATGWRWTRG